jgi:protein-export membrane protein SecD
MTMPGRFVISKLMSQMAKSGCKFCIVETTSEGIKQHRNAGIIYDIFVFTNLYPEHLPSHDNSFEKYKYTKSIPFRNLSNTSKIIDGKKIDRMIIVNKDSEHGDYYLQFNADKKSTYSIINESDNRAQEIVSLSDSVKFRLNGEEYTLKILGEFNIYNALPAIIIAKEFDISYQNIKNGLLNLNIIPGRMELIEAGQNYTVIVDYAHEKESMTNVLKTAVSIRKSPTSKIIVLLGAEGGGGQQQITAGGTAEVAIEFNSEGSQKFAEITRRNVGKPLAIFLDEMPVTWPNVNQEILGGNAVITGGFTPEAAKSLAVQLNAGALPVPIKVVEQRSIGASLGQESINKSLVAGIIGLATVIVYMVAYYGLLGIVAAAALIIYSLFTIAIFRTGLFLIPPITLTLAGIAGFVLSIGMAVDANILIFERMKEEKRWGKTTKQALELGFKRAWSSIRDSNISSLITAGILYGMGTGSIKGFAITLAIGVLVSMFTAITVTKTILKLFIKK